MLLCYSTPCPLPLTLYNRVSNMKSVTYGFNAHRISKLSVTFPCYSCYYFFRIRWI